MKSRICFVVFITAFLVLSGLKTWAQEKYGFSPTRLGRSASELKAEHDFDLKARYNFARIQAKGPQKFKGTKYTLPHAPRWPGQFNTLAEAREAQKKEITRLRWIAYGNSAEVPMRIDEINGHGDIVRVIDPATHEVIFQVGSDQALHVVSTERNNYSLAAGASAKRARVDKVIRELFSDTHHGEIPKALLDEIKIKITDGEGRILKFMDVHWKVYEPYTQSFFHTYGEAWDRVEFLEKSFPQMNQHHDYIEPLVEHYSE